MNAPEFTREQVLKMRDHNQEVRDILLSDTPGASTILELITLTGFGGMTVLKSVTKNEADKMLKHLCTYILDDLAIQSNEARFAAEDRDNHVGVSS